MTKQIINQPVSITALAFGKNMEAYPKRMEFEGRTYDFIDKGFRCVVKKHGQITHILTLSDGHRQFWLRSGDRGIWTLLGMSA